jgi:putative transposase
MNNYNPNIHHRRSIRLKGYDYSKEGLYFITICVKDRECLFGKIINGKIELNDAGIMIENEWLKVPDRFPNLQLHQYVIMPNHFHAIIEITVGPTIVVAQNNPIAHENLTKLLRKHNS